MEQHLHIEALGRRAEGIATHDGQTVFVARTLAGEDVTVDAETGKLLRIDRPSPDRVDPFCAYYGECGGCQLQHMAEQAYGAWKRDLVIQSFAQRSIKAEVDDLVDTHGAGRRRVSLHFRYRDGEPRAGFMALRSHDLCDIAACPILVPALSRGPDIARSLAAVLGDGDAVLTATETGVDAAVKAERKVVEREAPKLARFAETHDLARLSVNGETIVTRRPPVITMGGAPVVIPPGGFLQATAEGESVLAALVLEGLGKSKVVADLFCGCGPFALRIAVRAKVFAADSDKAAIAALIRAHRETSGLKPLTTEVRDLFKAPLVANELKEFDAVVFDPPRAGAEAQARQLARSKVKTAVAVSCDPQTLARDAEILIGGGYTLKRVTPVDQFKWSSHVETVAVFVRR
ncbi:MAG: RNA methyltransferase [Aestuariivirga sp.]